MSYKARPAANCAGGRIAWDLICSGEQRKIKLLWYAREMDDGTWCAEMDDGEFEEVDVLVVNWYKWHPQELAAIRAKIPGFVAKAIAAGESTAIDRDGVTA